MDRSFKESEDRFLVQCAWCGSKIRDDDQEDASGVCL